MKTIYKLMMSVVMLLCHYHASVAQQTDTFNQPLYLGKSEMLLKGLKEKANDPNKRGNPILELRVSESSTLEGEITFKHLEETANEYLIGQIENQPSSSFYIRFNNNELEGNIVLKNTRQAYKYYTDKQGNAYIKEISIDSVLCVNYEDLSGQDDELKTETTVDSRTNQAAEAQAVPILQSYPGARGVVLLDFDGHYVAGTPWNNGYPINARPSGMTSAQIREAWEIVSEDFRPFHVNITTSEAVFNSYPKNRRMRCIITPTNTAAPGAGGVAYIGSFNWNDDTPCWAFLTSTKSAGEVSSHEIGHTFGLGHDGRRYPSETYFSGHGNWAPIMGVSYYRNVTQWSRGEYNYANNGQDDLATISSSIYGVGYRTDDHGNTIATATALKVSSTGAVAASQNYGVVERTGDVDMFSFTTGGGNVQINFSPAYRHGNLDILVRLYNASGNLISSYNPSGLAASINTNLARGRYYVSVDGTGAGNPASNGYSEYASIGYYSISGTIPPGSGGNQSPVVSITSPSNGAAFNGPANITINASASDADGSVAKVEFFNGSTKIGEDTSVPYSFTWNNVGVGTYNLTARATDNAGAVKTSAAVSVTVRRSQGGCTTPSGLAAKNITTSSVTLTWAAQSGASGYAVWWRPVGGTWNRNTTVTTNSTNIIGLQSGTTFEFTVSAYCGGSYTAYASPYRFTTSTPVNNVATFYQYFNYNTSGFAVSLPPGRYTLSQLYAKGIRNNDISSLRVRSGYEVILYRDDNFQGGGWLFRSDYACLADVYFNDITSSIIIRRSTAAAVAYNDGIATATLENEPELISTTPVVAPNPFADKVIMKFHDPMEEGAQVQVVDTYGKKILSIKKARAGEEIDLSGLSSGVYLLKIRIGNQLSVQRVIKQ